MENNEGIRFSDEESLEERYTKMIKELVAQGWSPRKARKYLEAISRKQIEKTFKHNVPKAMKSFKKRCHVQPINMKKIIAEEQQKQYADEVMAAVAEMEQSSKE